MKVMIAAGGTGGHIYPALAFAQELKTQQPDAEIIFFGSDDRMEAKLIPEKGYRFYGVHMKGTNGGIFAKIQSVLSLLKAQKIAKKILQNERPNICIGFGNYIEVPLILAAKKLNIKTMLHEQNSFAGKANKFLAKKVDAIVASYDSNLEQMHNTNQKVLGNPEASIAAKTVYDNKLLQDIGLDPEKPFVLCMMGSLGSQSVSKIIDDACPLFDETYQVVIAHGKSNPYQYSYKSNDRIKIVDYVDGKSMLKGCKVAVVRAGATTMAEIGAIGVASIVIPSPYVPNNHQYYNAKALIDCDGAVMLEEKDLNAQLLADTLNSLMRDNERCDTLRKNAKKQGTPNASQDMIAWMGEILHE